jgi:DNA-binding IclR family transcriptional regulator
MASSLGTAFDILELFERPTLVRLTLSEVAEALGVARSTASTTLRDLAEAGYLVRLSEGREALYVMGPRFQLSFANAVLREREGLLALGEQAQRMIRRAAELFGEAGRVLADAPEPQRGPATGEGGHGSECGAIG